MRMLKTIMRLFITLTILTALSVGILYFYNKGRTFYNSGEQSGNSAGNIYNGGLFSEYGGRIYFSNDQDGGALYVMNSDLSNARKLRNDKAVFINVDDNYIYYIKANDSRESDAGQMMFYNTGVYRIKKNGSELMAFTSKPSSYLTLKGNNVYFQRYDLGTGLSLYRYQIDGSLERKLVKEAVIPVHIADNELYFTASSEGQGINKINLKSFITYPAYDGSYSCPIFRDGYIYFIDISDDNKIYRMNMDCTDKLLLVDGRCSSYNITNSGIYLYYQLDDGDNSGIYRLKLDTMESTLLQAGSYKHINVTQKYVFFRDSDNSNTYVISADGYPEVSIFAPEASVSDSR